MTRETFPLAIRLLHRLNPLIRWLLRSRLHFLMSGELLVLEYRGRKTGNTYAIPLAYVTHAGQPHCMTRLGTSWLTSVVEAPSVTIWLRGKRLSATAERIPSASPDARPAFAAFLSANPGTARMLYRVRVDSRRQPDANDLEREIHNSVVIRVS